jgi:hypothetical protein
MPPRLLHPLLLVAVAATVFVAGCGGDSDSGGEGTTAAEPFEPQASIAAIGGTARTDKPELVTRVEARPGDVGIRSAAVTLPAAFIVDQTQIRNLCSESELEEDECAGRKPMGVARIVSPVFDEALTGPVYAVSGSGGLPRLAYVLGGPAEFLLRGRIVVRGARIEATLEDAPNTPLETFELTIDGGPPGYLILSRDICRSETTADVSFTSQSGETFAQRIPLAADCGA